MIEVAAAAVVVALAGGRLTAKPPAETVHLEVNGSTWTGTYNATSTAGGCTVAKDGTWTNELYVSSATALTELVNLPITVPKAKLDGDNTEFYLAVGLGPLSKRDDLTYQLEVETRANQKRRGGSGTVTIADKGETAVITFTAKTATGAGLEGTVNCNTVTRKK
jgi:hypothetical protein